MNRIFALAMMITLGMIPSYALSQPPAPTLAVKVTGAGKNKSALVFLPGFACSGSVWDETAARYQSRYVCYAFTMPGFAGAPAESAPTLNGWVDAIAAYIKSNKLINPIIIGHSMGGGMALMLATRYPGLASKIVVVDALPCLSAAMNPNFQSQQNPDCAAMVTNMTGMSDSAFYKMEKMVIPRLMVDTVHQPDVIDWGVHSDRKTYAEMYCQFGNADQRESVKGIHCPALVLLEAPFVSIKETVEGQYKNLAGAKLVYANKGLHFIMFDDKDWYLGQLDSFLLN